MTLLSGDCLDQLKTLEPNSADSLVTDPPAGISFMGKDWDSDKGGRAGWIAWMTEVMTECMRVMKPGAHGLVWAIPRTSHWTATALEDAGFEVRDVVTHLFGSGFPKSLNVSIAIDKQAGALKARGKAFVAAGAGERKDIQGTTGAEAFESHEGITDSAKKWQGWGTALKPASEHWILIRKPCSEKTVAANVLKWGCGAINIDGSRVGTSKEGDPNRFVGTVKSKSTYAQDDWTKENYRGLPIDPNQGRFPANLVLDEEAAMALDEQSGTLKTGGLGKSGDQRTCGVTSFGQNARSPRTTAGDSGGDSGGASRFFYVAKASKKDKGIDNTHPTVKSTNLMQYLIRMITPPNGTVLDPFMGSGSTGVACVNTNRKFIGIERDPDYMAIAEKRIFNAFPEFKKQVHGPQSTG
jgi:DNA modification methylase